MQFVKQKRLPAKAIKWLEGHLTNSKEFEDCRKDDVIYRETVEFINGKQMDIKVCNARTSEGGAWTEGVLFDKNGNELGCTEVGDTILGEFSVEHDGDKYTVMIGEEK